MEYPTEVTISSVDNNFVFGLRVRLGNYDYRYEGITVESIDPKHLKSIVTDLLESIIKPGSGKGYYWSWSNVDQE